MADLSKQVSDASKALDSLTKQYKNINDILKKEKEQGSIITDKQIKYLKEITKRLKEAQENLIKFTKPEIENIKKQIQTHKDFNKRLAQSYNEQNGVLKENIKNLGKILGLNEQTIANYTTDGKDLKKAFRGFLGVVKQNNDTISEQLRRTRENWYVQEQTVKGFGKRIGGLIRNIKEDAKDYFFSKTGFLGQGVQFAGKLFAGKDLAKQDRTGLEEQIALYELQEKNLDTQYSIDRHLAEVAASLHSQENIEEMNFEETKKEKAIKSETDFTTITQPMVETLSTSQETFSRILNTELGMYELTTSQNIMLEKIHELLSQKYVKTNKDTTPSVLGMRDENKGAPLSEQRKANKWLKKIFEKKGEDKGGLLSTLLSLLPLIVPAMLAYLVGGKSNIGDFFLKLGGKIPAIGREAGIGARISKFGKGIQEAAYLKSIDMFPKLFEKIVDAFAIMGKMFKPFSAVTKMGAIGKGALKKLPFLAPIFGIIFAAKKWQNGDKAGAMMELASGFLSMAGPFGIAASILLDVGSYIRDSGIEKSGQKNIKQGWNPWKSKEMKQIESDQFTRNRFMEDTSKGGQPSMTDLQMSKKDWAKRQKQYTPKDEFAVQGRPIQPPTFRNPFLDQPLKIHKDSIDAIASQTGKATGKNISLVGPRIDIPAGR